MNDIQFVNNLKHEVEEDINKLIKKFNINELIKFIIVTMEDMFDMHHIHEHPIGFSKEVLAEELSYVLYTKLDKDKNKINLSEIVSANYQGFLEKNSDLLKRLYNFLMVRNILRNMEISIEKQGYTLINSNNILKVSHSIQNLEHYDKLGYFRNMLENVAINITCMGNTKTKMDNILELVTKHDAMRIMNYEIRDAGTYRELIVFGFDAIGLTTMTKFITDEHNAKYNQLMSKYFENSQIELTNKCTAKGEIRWIDLFNISIILHYVANYISKIIEEKATSRRMANNSKMLLITNEQLEDFFTTIFFILNENITKQEIKNFINRFTINLANNSKRIDLQFNPIIKIKDHNFVLFNTFSLSDIVRAYINNNNLMLDDQGKKFENEVYNALCIVFNKNNLYAPIKYLDHQNQKGEIDICLLGEKNIYFIECKNRLLPISISSATNNYEYIFKAKTQLEQVENYFNNDRALFIKNHLKRDIPNIEEYSLYKIIILSNKNISGLNFDGVAVRDIFSLDRLITSGEIKSMIMNEEKEVQVVSSISLYQNKENFQENDFVKYISDNFIYFNELNKLVQHCILQFQYKEYTLESFDYAFDMKKMS